MVRGRGRGSSYRGNPWNSGRGGGRGDYSGGSSGRFSSFSDRSSERYPREDYHKSYRPANYDENYSSRDNYRSPERKRQRNEGASSRHDSFSAPYSSGGRYSESHGQVSYSDRRSYSGGGGERPSSTPYQSRRDEFRKPSGPTRGSFRGRLSTRGSMRGTRLRERGGRRRLIETSYAIRKRPRGYRGIKVSRIRSGIIRHKRISEKEGSSDEDEKAQEETGETEVEVKKEVEDREAEEKKQTEEKSVKDDEEDEDEGDEKPQKTYIKLVCPHCNIKIPTFRRYEMHLQGKAHLFSMRRLAMKQKAILAQMRQAQRKSQNELEKKSSNEDLSAHTHYCQLCRLNYKQPKEVHQETESHKNMKKFLMPRCKVCNITFKSPMVYENHCCSIQHIKRKQQQQLQQEASEVSGDDDNLEDFTTIDSVGDVDENVSDDDKDKKEKKEPVNVGIEKIKKVESHYCELCRIYLPRGSDEDIQKILSKHCKMRVHMQRYIRYKENQELEKKAEKLQRKETAEKEKKKEVEVKKEEDNADEKREKDDDKADVNKTAEDDKLWEAVDKDLGELLGEADGNKSEDDDDDDSHVNGERYDRFKFEEKKAKAESEKAAKDEAKVETAKKDEEK